MDKKLIYIADDEINICNIIKSFLIKENYSVETFYDGNSILDAFKAKQANLVIMDVMMPGIDGYSLCPLIREISSVPIIIVSAKDTEPDKIAGLTLGADDYLTKPFSPIELIARIKSIFRRIELDNIKVKTNEAVGISDISINADIRQANYCGRNIGLTTMEFSLLYYLIVNKNRAVSRKELLDKIWGFESDVETRATDDMIKRIRKKLTACGSYLKIDTIWGFGFTIQDKD